jgi:hypothetical protein
MNMCFCRALTNGAKTYCPDVMVGNQIYTPDELDPQMKLTVTPEGDVVPDADYEVAQPAPVAKMKEEDTKEVETLFASLEDERKVKFLEYFKVESVAKLNQSDRVKALGLLREREKAKTVSK